MVFRAFFTLPIPMLNQPASSPRQLGRYLLAAPLVVALALGHAGARAQTAAAIAPPAPLRVVLDAPRITGPVPAYFMNGQRLDPLDLSKIEPNDIASINVLGGDAALALAPDAMGGVILITTKGHEQAPVVLALNEQVEKILPPQTERRVEMYVLVPKALATITARYPSARLSGEVVEVTTRATREITYKVQLIRAKRPFYIYLTPEGEFISE